METLLTSAEVCELLKRSKASFARDRAKGNAPQAIRIGGSLRFRPSDVAQFIQEHTEEDPA